MNEQLRLPPPAKEPDVEPGLLDRAVANLRDLWRGIAGSTTEAPTRLAPNDVQRMRKQVLACLEGRGGEVSARARAAALGHEYLGLTRDDRKLFLGILADDFGPDSAAIARAASDFLGATTESAKRQAARSLKRALEAPRVELLTQFNALPEGVKFLVDMRAELLAFTAEHARYRGLLEDLTGLLRRWFDIGFLELRRITWDAPASLLEKLIAYEAVHEISSWADLKNRLAPDRRCFGYFHPGMPDEPLIFVEVALTDGMADNVAALLDTDAPVAEPGEADAAIFYSISNAQQGLAGISFGNFLIKRVVELLAQEFPKLKTFATLSPVPGFRKWFEAQPPEELMTDAERKAVPGGKDEDFHPVHILDRTSWPRRGAVEKALRQPLQRAMARYLVHGKRPDGRALDPVAHFHLSNGARLERINWLGDPSPKGMRQSAGMMVNYLYRRDSIDANHEAYTGEGKVSAASAIRSLAKKV